MTTPAPSAPQPLTVTTMALVVLTSALWGGTPVALSFSGDTLPPVLVAGIRFLIAMIPVWVFCRISRTALRFDRRQFRWIVAMAVFLFVQIATFNIGTVLTSSSHSTLIINTFVFFVVLIEHFVTRTDRLTGRKVVGLVVAFVGTLVIFRITNGTSEPDTGRDPATLLGDLLLLASSVLLGFKIVFTKCAVTHVPPNALVFWHNLLGAGMFFLYSACFEDVDMAGFTTPAILGILYQGLLVAGLCFPIQAVLLRKHSATQISVFSFLTPVFGVALGVSLRGDSLSPWLIVSGVLVALGILLVNLKSRQA